MPFDSGSEPAFNTLLLQMEQRLERRMDRMEENLDRKFVGMDRRLTLVEQRQEERLAQQPNNPLSISVGQLMVMVMLGLAVIASVFLAVYVGGRIGG